MTTKRDGSRSVEPVFGVAWYSRADWPKLLAAATDRDVLEDSYDEWVEFYESSVAKLTAGGLRWVRVPVSIDELVAWCGGKGRPLDGAARAEFTALKTREWSRGEGEA